MKNVDVPMWDKGDSTDNFAKGGGRSSAVFDRMVENDKRIIELFELVLGRKPSTRESAYYRISKSEDAEVIEKLVRNSEHKELVVKAKNYPSLLKENKKQKSSILKLKSSIEDREKEFEEMEKLLEEKNTTIKELREEKGKPFLTNEDLVKESNQYYSKISESKSKSSYDVNDQSLWDRILQLFFNK